MADPIVIVGAGQAGAALAAKLRALGYAGPLALIGAEPVPPYQRPPLSKKYVSRELTFDRLLVRPASWYAEQQIDLRLDCAAVAIDPAEKTLSLSDGTRLRYVKLALTTGARPRRLPPEIGGDLGGVFAIRTVSDADAIAPLLQPGKRLLVIGGAISGWRRRQSPQARACRSRSSRWRRASCSASPPRRPPIISARCIGSTASRSWNPPPSCA